MLGVRVFEDSLARRLGVRDGALVRDVTDNSGAAVAGIRPTYVDDNGDIQLGDVIVEIVGRPIRAVADIAKALDARKPGERTLLVVDRAGKRVPLTVELRVAAPQK